MRQWTLIAALMISLHTSAMAEDNRNSFYVAGMISLGNLTDADFSSNFIADLPDRQINSNHGITDWAVLGFENGIVGSGAIGYQHQLWRLEVEGSWRNNSLDSTWIHNPKFDQGTKQAPDDGNSNDVREFEEIKIAGTSISAVSAMANAWRAFGIDEAMRPFVGAGIGVARLTANTAQQGDASYTGLAWQVGGGLEYDAFENTTLTLGLRYFRTQKPKFEWEAKTLETEYHSFDIGIGLRYRFN